MMSMTKEVSNMIEAKKVSTLLFDLDGVLWDGKEVHYEALNEALGEFEKGAVISREDHLAIYDGLPTREKLRMLSERGVLREGLHGEVLDRKQEITRVMIAEGVERDGELVEVLGVLLAEGFRMGVCSNAVRSTVESVLRRKGLLEYFSVVLSNEDVERSKPDEGIYVKAFEELGVCPEGVVIFEDSEYGLEAARRSGGYVCRVEDRADFVGKLQGYVGCIV